MIQQSKNFSPANAPLFLSMRASRIFFGLSAAAFGAVIVGLLVIKSIGGEIAHGGHSNSIALHEIIIGNDVLSVTANMIRFPGQRVSGSSDRLDLYALWPLMNGYSNIHSDAFNAGKDREKIIFLSLEKRSMSRDMAGRVDRVYSQFFDGPAQPTAFGLMRQPLSVSSGLVDEDLYLEIDSPYPFATRCVRETSAIGEPYCLRDIFMGRNLSLTYRFHISLLPEWASMERMVRKRIKLMLVN
ncbi:MAG: hypothetical protein COB78_10625 [Hyphomicrobiales bacterium]|nr:MAG: hypothetical protein COB78_10625 [Hyphomicrobiales bacterium]